MYKLLIADDEPVIRQGLLSIDWESIGVSVIAEVDNGVDAVELIQSEFVDILLTDIKMPGMDGIDIARFISEQELFVPQIFPEHNDELFVAQVSAIDEMEMLSQTDVIIWDEPPTEDAQASPSAPISPPASLHRFPVRSPISNPLPPIPFRPSTEGP